MAASTIAPATAPAMMAVRFAPPLFLDGPVDDDGDDDDEGEGLPQDGDEKNNTESVVLLFCCEVE